MVCSVVPACVHCTCVCVCVFVCVSCAHVRAFVPTCMGARHTDVGAKCDGIDALDADDTESDERRERGREDGAALHEHRHSGSDQQSDVAREERQRREVRVQCLPDHLQPTAFRINATHSRFQSI